MEQHKTAVPGPASPHARPWPLLGHLVPLLRRPLAFMQDARGMGEVAEIRVGTTRAYLVNSPELIKRILVTDADQFADLGNLFERPRKWIGPSVVLVTGEQHQRQRRALQPAFRRTVVEEQVETIRQAVVAAGATWEAGRPLAVRDEMYGLIIRMTYRYLFGADPAPKVLAELVRLLPVVEKGMAFHVINPLPVLSGLPLPSFRRFFQAVDRVNQVMSDAVSLMPQPPGAGFVSAARDAHPGGQAELVRAEATAMLLGAVPNTSAMLTWALHELAAAPGLQQELRDEVRTVTGGRAVTAGDLHALGGTTRFVQEILRLYAPWLITRRTTAPVVLGTVRLPAGALILISLHALHRDPKMFENPDVCDPARWLPGTAQPVPRETFLPFGAGKRRCIGEPLALVELIITVATVLADWEVRPLAARDGGIPRRLATTAVVHPADVPIIPVPCEYQSAPSQGKEP
ncbi:cytochrome P450 [Streptomyces sp. NPDC020379]|uniref:cytochrome P450 n=1 Tax=Streptomyces sp. NPDC020379 TaxID=3365071 RepID=UPI003799B92D